MLSDDEQYYDSFEDETRFAIAKIDRDVTDLKSMYESLIKNAQVLGNQMQKTLNITDR